MSYLLIGIGGAFGALTRFIIGKWINEKWNSLFPIGTLIINLTGALTLGLLTALFYKNMPSSHYTMAAVTTGFLGAYTTFSTFTFETISLIERGEILKAASYVILSVLLGILLCFGAYTFI